jgi:hypothetical protein
MIDLTPIETWGDAKELKTVEVSSGSYKVNINPGSIRSLKNDYYSEHNAIFMRIDSDDSSAPHSYMCMTPDDAEALASRLLMLSEYARKVQNGEL